MSKIYRIFLLLIAISFFVSCGNSDDSGGNAEVQPEKVEFNLTGNDQMKFNLNTMVVNEGDRVIVNFVNIGKMAKEVMGHNFVLLKQGVDLAAFAAKAAAEKDNEYIPAGELDNIIVYSKLLGPGEETVIEFTAPAKGSYKYVCSFPGHYTTMQGTLIVR